MTEQKIETFTVTILNWEKHNGSKKKGHNSFLFSCRFFDDAKISTLTPQEQIIYIWLLTRSADECCTTHTTSASRAPHRPGTKSLRLLHALRRLEQLQLVRIEKIEFLNNRKERKGKEKKGKEIPARSDGPSPAGPENPLPPPASNKPPAPPKSSTKNPPGSDANRRCWESYRAAYQDRYHVEPTRNAAVNSQIANFVKRVGSEDAPAVIAFYVHHRDGLYLKSMHPVSLALRDAEGLRTQWLKGRAVTSRDVRQGEDLAHTQDQLDRIRQGTL